jgi:hypothetical protein
MKNKLINIGVNKMKLNKMKYVLLLVLFALPASMFGALNDEFLSVTSYSDVTTNYKSIEGDGGVKIPASNFERYPALITDQRDGYYKVNLDWPFSFAGTDRTTMYICVNGFVTFDTPLNLNQRNSDGLFENQLSTYAKNVIAPFWGDHFYRTDATGGYTKSAILIKKTADYVTVEWKNINMNAVAGNFFPSSIGNFQLTFKKSADPLTNQGDIEFSYGLVNGGLGATVITEGATIGLKGDGGTTNKADFLNGLCNDTTNLVACDPTDSREKTSIWQPSGGTNIKILFTHFPTTTLMHMWGDGDTDLSHGFGSRHFGEAQNRFVTFADVRAILRSVATEKPLDSIRGRHAYHADVNHNGRFALLDSSIWLRSTVGSYPFKYVDDQGRTVSELPSVTDPDSMVLVDQTSPVSNTFEWKDADDILVPEDSTVKHNIITRSYNWNDSIPADVPSLTQVYWLADEHDASFIVSYLSVQITNLPWIYDIIGYKDINFRKASNMEPLASDVNFGTAVKTAKNTYSIPVYANGIIQDGVSLRIKTDAAITDVNSDNANSSNIVLSDFDKGNMVIVTNADYNSSTAIAWLEINTDKSTVDLSGIRLNGETLENRTINLRKSSNEQELIDANKVIVRSIPSGVSLDCSFEIDGLYTAGIYDLMGNFVASLGTKQFEAGETMNFEWNNLSNQSGMYMYRISGDAGVYSGKINIVK